MVRMLHTRSCPGAVGAMALAAFLLAGAAQPARAVDGDFDGDGLLKKDDAIGVMHTWAGIVIPTAEEVSRADLTGPSGSPDGLLDHLDVVALIRQIYTSPQSLHPLPFQDTLTLTADRVWDVNLTGGYRYTGKVLDTQGNSASDWTDFYRRTTSFVRFAGSGITTEGRVAPNTGSYSAVVNGGSNDVVVFTFVETTDPSTFAFGQIQASFSAVPPSIEASSDTEQDFTRPDLPGTATLTGTISATDVQVSGVQITGLDGSAYTSVGSTNAYSLETYPLEGRVNVTGRYTGVPPPGPLVGVRLAQTVALGENETKTLDVTMLPLKQLEGTITTPDGLPASQINVNAAAPNGSDEYSSSQFLGNGDFLLALPAGEYIASISLQPGGSRVTLTNRQAVTVEEGGTLWNPVVQDPPAMVTLSGRVVGPDGMPIAKGVLVFTSQNQGDWSAAGSATTASDGTYSIRLLPGPYDVHVDPPVTN